MPDSPFSFADVENWATWLTGLTGSTVSNSDAANELGLTLAGTIVGISDTSTEAKRHRNLAKAALALQEQIAALGGG